MGFWKRFGKPEKETPRKTEETAELEVYSGMRVEVMTAEGSLLFVAKLLGLHEDKAELHQYSEAALSLGGEPAEALPVKIRGYSDHDRKAVYMEGSITQKPKRVWGVESLKVVRIANDRAFFRLTTMLDATVTMFSGLMIGERPCKMLNISVGGARLSSSCRYHEGDKFLLKVRLLEERPESAMFCQVLRVIEREDEQFEYGCQFLELTEEDQEKIMENIFTVQRQKRSYT